MSVVIDKDPAIFQVSGEIAHIGKPPFPYIYSNPVSVTSEDGQLIGAARIFVQGDTLAADLFLNYSIPERLDIENGEKYYLKAVAVRLLPNSVQSIDSLVLDKTPLEDKRLSHVR